MNTELELVVLGSGPAGQRAAIQAAKLGRSVALVERRAMMGGVCVNTGTIPSKTLREAVVFLTGMSQREMYGDSYRVKTEITVADLRQRTTRVIAREVDVIRNQLQRNHVELVQGTARLLDRHTVAVADEAGSERVLFAKNIVIAVGTCPAHPPEVDFDGRTIIDSDGLLNLERIPDSLVVVGAGVIGIEYASMLAALGTKVTIVERRPQMLEFCDGEVVEALQHHLRDLGVIFRFGDAVTAVERPNGGALTHLASGKRIAADAVFYAAGRQGATAQLGLEQVGIEVDERGRIAVGADFRTAVDNVFAVGDVIGFPSLAATSSEQGRLAARHACGVEVGEIGALLPIGIYAIPEISFVGRTEEELSAAGIPYETGISRYRELARGQIIGDSYGMLKLLVCPDSRCLLGVHVFGTGATEIIHLGQAVMAFGGTVDYLVDSVFNYPTLAEAYKVAALDATNKLTALLRLTG
ncbi:MAG: Si-specific NAD(P)(+) transhydrogenase [Gaiella sp.]